MSLRSEALSQVDGLAPFADDSYMIAASDGRVTLQCELSTLDRLALAFRTLTAQHNDLVGAPISTLETVAADLASRISYLLEDVSPVEIDSEGVRVQLRSSPPSRDGDTIRYYELLLRSQDGSASLVRYEAVRGLPGRHAIPSEVTREVFGRLVDDLTRT
jgi:hypothetical protein